MIQEIIYNGHTAVPSDYEVTDGDLAISLGVVKEDYSLKPIYNPSDVLTLEQGESVKHIHKTSNIYHYIIVKTLGGGGSSTKGFELKYSDGENTYTIQMFSGGNVKLYQITSIGNTLVVLTSIGMYYFLWKENEYYSLGSQIPELPLSFGLVTSTLNFSENFNIEFPEAITISNGDSYNKFSEDNKTAITSIVLAQVNKFIADRSTNAGRFMFPFFVRYALRLYDGTHTHHSAPILMNCANYCTPIVMGNRLTDGVYSSFRNFYCFAPLHNLNYEVVDNNSIDDLNKWSDIVQAVDVFISAPIYTYKQSGECESVASIGYALGHGAYSVGAKETILETEHPYKKNNLFGDLMAQEYLTTKCCIELPQYDAEQINNSVIDNSQFYLLKSIKINELPKTRTTFDVKDDYLPALLNRERLEDDYDSHDTLIPKYSFVYNQRLNITNIKKQLFEGFLASSALQLTIDNVTSSPNNSSVRCYVTIKTDAKEIIVRNIASTLGEYPVVDYFFYPNTNATSLIIEVINNYGTTRKEYKLTPHPYLNGAYYFSRFSPKEESSGGVIVPGSPQPTADNTVNILNKIYTSEINNPFFFPLLGINTVGAGEIIGISTSAKALSEGQFGQFPLYAFTTEGVWALEVGQTGAYLAKQPITRDVCINTDSITQIDNAVLFATDRGIMLISGSQTTCISDVINGENPFSVADLPKAESIVNIFNTKANKNETITLSDIMLLPFLDFVKNCKMLYDYTHQHIIAFNPLVKYAYVYSLNSKQWGMIVSNIVDSVNSYPDALAMAIIEQDIPVLINYSKPTDDNVTALIVTRPIKFGENINIFKTIDTIIQRGFCKSNNVQQILYGSNDLYNWHTIWSSENKYMRGFSGSPYKMFRLVIFCKLDKDERLTSCSVDVKAKRLNQLR